MSYRDDQLVGCLPDDTQNDLNLDDLITDTNQQQSLQFDPLIGNSTNQYIVGSQSQSNQLANNSRSNQFEAVQNADFISQSNSQYLVDNKNNFSNFQTADFNKDFQLNQLPTTSFDSNLDLFDIEDELQLSHLKDLENLMDTTQVKINDNLNCVNEQLSSQQQLNQQKWPAQFVISSNTPANPTFDNNFTPINTTSAQIYNASSNLQTNKSNANNLNLALNSFITGVNIPTDISNPNNFISQSKKNQLNNNSSQTNFSSQLTNNTNNQLPAHSDYRSLNINLNNLAKNNQIENTFLDQQGQTFCLQSTIEDNFDTSSTIRKPDTLHSSNILSSNLNCFFNKKNPLNQTDQINNELINSNQLLNNQSNFTDSSNIQSNLQTMIATQSTDAKHLNLPQFKTSPTNNNLLKIPFPSDGWLDMVANRIAADMKKCGICVIDKFLGSLFCDRILKEVVEMYSDGYFKNGLLVGKKETGDKNIRGDKIHWVDGNESNCQNINHLMCILDQILIRFSSLNVEGDRPILNRTKAMIACYPAQGTKYVKHVDNPNRDGRYITCIYYLNKNWDSSRDGGSLRIFPKGLPFVANIEPLFDRLIFFWSDLRNPHEVMPAYSMRFAITLWYFDFKEREEHNKRMQQLQSNLEIS